MQCRRVGVSTTAIPQSSLLTVGADYHVQLWGRVKLDIVKSPAEQREMAGERNGRERNGRERNGRREKW